MFGPAVLIGQRSAADWLAGFDQWCICCSTDRRVYPEQRRRKDVGQYRSIVQQLCQDFGSRKENILECNL